MHRSGRLSACRLLFSAGILAGITPGLIAAPLTIDRLMQIKHPSNPTPSPDGKYVAFAWDEGGVWNLYLISTSGSTSAPVKLTAFPSGQVNDFFWSANGKALLFPHEGELWRVDVANGKVSSPAHGTGVRGSGFAASRDGRELAFVQSSKGGGAELLVAAAGGGSPKRIAHNDTSIGGLAWSP